MTGVTGPDSQQLVGPITVGPIADGGHCVARHDGRVIFVRHALPGEQVMIAYTDTSQPRFWRADAHQIITASPDRVDPPCPVAGPGLCGGCDFQHVALPAQRSLKTAVVAEQLERLAGISWRGIVEEVPTAEGDSGLHWRTRMRYLLDHSRAGEPVVGLRAHRSHQVIPLPDQGCLIADRRIANPGLDLGSRELDGSELIAVAAERPTFLLDGELTRGERELTECAAGRDWVVDADGFWQVHPAAADILVDAVLDGLEPVAGERAFDLFCGVGLFTGALADRGCAVWGVESSAKAIALARRNVAGPANHNGEDPWSRPARPTDGRPRFTVGRVDRVLRQLPKRTDLVVLDPPRAGARREVMTAVINRQPRRIAYVACDPAALARDLGIAQQLGYRAISIRGFDLFPMTQHVECVAIVEPGCTAGE